MGAGGWTSPADLPWQEGDPAWVAGLGPGSPPNPALELCTGDGESRVLVAHRDGATAVGDYAGCNLSQ